MVPRSIAADDPKCRPKLMARLESCPVSASRLTFVQKSPSREAQGRGVNKVVYRSGDLRVDPANRRLIRGDKEIALEPKAFAVLLVLLERAGELVTRDQLLDAVWGHRHITPATLNRVMTLLRRAFDDDADHPRFIHTVHGAGYRFVGAVERVAVPRGEFRAHFEPPPIAQLPAKLEPLIGRDRELAQLCAMLSEHRAVTVIGPGGMGNAHWNSHAAARGNSLTVSGSSIFRR
jgi:DNA-binding winged helix-turn-helix (wHTH) protein